MSLSKDQILNARDMRVEAVNVPDWGGQVFVRTLTGPERELLEERLSKKASNIDFMILLLVLTLCDEQGNRLFTEKDSASLKQKNSAVLLHVFQAASRLNAVSTADVEDLAKNSESAPGDDSGSTSPATKE